MKRKRKPGKNPDAIIIPRHPFRWLVCGRSGSGKTTATIPFVRKHIIPQVNKVIAIVSTFSQPAYDTLRAFIKPEDTFDFASEKVFALIKENLIAHRFSQKVLLIIDDQAGTTAIHGVGRKGPFNELIPNARHWNISIVLITQNLTSVTPALRDNADFLSVFYTTNEKEMNLLRKEFNPSFTVKHGFLIMYLAALGGVNRDAEVYSFLFVSLQPPFRFFRKFEEELTYDNVRFERGDSGSSSEEYI